MPDEQKPENINPGVPPVDGVLRINITFQVLTGKIEVSGHIGNTDLCTKVLVEAAHVIMVRNSENDMKAMQANKKVLEVLTTSVKRNGDK